MNSNSYSSYLLENDTKALARIDEILARSRRVVEESMELSKRSVEQKVKINTVLETSQSTENSFLFPRKYLTKEIEVGEEAEAEGDYERALDEVNNKIKALETKAAADEKALDVLRFKIKQASGTDKGSGSRLEYDLLQADRLLATLQETLSTGLLEENKRLKQEFEALLKKRSAEEAKYNKELEEVIRERKVLETQLKNLKYLAEHSPNYQQELDEAKNELRTMEYQAEETIRLLESKIQEQTEENAKLKELLKSNDPDKLSVVKVKYQDQAKQNQKLLKSLKKH